MEIEKRYCQSCGMPLDIHHEELFGTNSDQTKSEEFCFYCYQNGQYTVDYSMKKIIDVWVENTDLFNNHIHTKYTPDELRTILNRRLPTLKRWKQKNDTENVYYEIMNRIKVYINSHLFDTLNTELLSKIAGLSRFHFLRTFKAYTGESVGNYIQRIRLEYIAHLFLTTELSLNNIIQQTNYQTKHSLSKAFKKHFGLSPTDYKEQNKHSYSDMSMLSKGILPQIKKISGLSIVYRAIDNTCSTTKEYKDIWKELLSFTESNIAKSPENKFVSVSMDDPLITLYSNCRFFIGITVNQKVKPKGKFGMMDIPEGYYAVFKYKGNYSSLPNLYRYIYLMWLPRNEYRQKNTFSFELYIKTPIEEDDNNLLTEIYIPIEKRTKK
ncbi:GyrI-like domain-containing protein [Parabacteroides faecis]|uniref:GyrI-like domain-containing protein n=1 Tax=Parabacteroides TaxID=375288 RepID=UPI000EFFC945|nr:MULTISPECIES: GyrI-like domain-containing protein [Parabacteroides]MBC8618307.1 GyrI-like domain-containing protein [Parabacteroides faecis]RHS00483.1 helix-turn-helix domain-containing protein [Parabacteroides sp. AF14-59]